ncbi:hypothetical protein COLO4_37988 [Corchorus olitorius]|uniref:Rapid ALkalinization Factor n=1 Tax=Corchorus olitorius TaxID=93759 RepID=A0A1R3FXQ1_9ROSI|nr:hypothetical protein COLO4_37988 [Corchorus olitorius]
MGYKQKRGPQNIATLLKVLLLFFNYHYSSASTINTSGSLHHCSGSMQECLIDDIVDDLNPVLFADPETSLATPSIRPGGQVTKGFANKKRPVVDCGRPGKPYKSCLPTGNNPTKVETCGTYKRRC